MRSGWLTQGPAVEAFENAAKDYVGAKYAVAVSNGTTGLHIAALAADVGPGDTLVTSPITFVASSNAAFYCGAKPLFADIDPETINLSPEKLKTVLAENPNVKAIVPVHFGGLPCDMLAIKHLADKAGAHVIEDAAHALGAQYEDGGMVGNCAHSDMTVFYFHPVKAIAAGEGGLVTTNDEALYRRLLRLRSHGINKLDDLHEQPAHGGPWYYEMQELGYNYRITDLQSALALSQLKKLDKFIARRRQSADVYDEAFGALENCRPAQPMGRDRSGLHLYVLRINLNAIGMNKTELMLALRERGVGSQVHYIPVPAHPFYREHQYRPDDYADANTYYAEALSIPLFFDLTDEQQQCVINAFEELVG
jgi:UDP-4-amino-4,6-dideoxy-N-acetyl-beta-L-altrosamine transaminase